MKQEKGKDFSIIFKEIESFNNENPSFVYNLMNEEELQEDENIREFGEICQQINSSECAQYSSLTFS